MIFLAAILWPRPRHPRVGRVLGCEDFDEDVDKDVDEDIDEDKDIIEDVDEGANKNVNENEYMKVEGRKKVAKAKASQSRPSPWPRSIVNDGNCSLASSSI